VKKIVLVLGLVTGIVTNAQSAEISGNNGKVYQVTRLNFDSVEVKSISRGEVLGTDTMNLSRFLTLTNGYKITSGNLHNPIPIAPKITEHKHEHKSELKEYWKRITTPGNPDYNEFWGIISVVGACLVFDWAYEPTKVNWTPSGFNNIPSGGGVYPIGGGRCSAIASSTGQRCKRSSESGRAYCWQH
jgi:hypothetical protein